MIGTGASTIPVEEFAWEGRRIAWRSLGAGPAVVMCHGTPWSMTVWDAYARALARDYSVFLWDMPGYGASSKEPGHAVDLDVQGRVLAALVDYWGIDAPHVVAHDIGAAAAVRAVVLQGTPVASLLLADPVLVRPWGTSFLQLVKQHSGVFEELPEHIHRGAIEAYVTSACHRDLRPEELAHLVAPWLGATGQSAFYRQLAQLDERHTDEIMPAISNLGTTPTRILWGELDSWLPTDCARAVREMLPHSTFRVIADAGHLLQLDAPAALADELREWLANVGVERPPRGM